MRRHARTRAKGPGLRGIRTSGLIAAVICAIGLAPAAAQGATVLSWDGSEITLDGTSNAQTNLEVEIFEEPGPWWHAHFSSWQPFSAPAQQGGYECFDQGFNMLANRYRAQCNVDALPHFTITTGDGADTIGFAAIFGTTQSIGIKATTGAGNDSVGASAPGLSYGPLEVSAGDGNDSVLGTHAVDEVDLGAGADTFSSAMLDDSVVGGEGTDRVLLKNRADYEQWGYQSGVMVDLGAEFPGFENVYGTHFSGDHLIGTDGPNSLVGNGGADTLDGRGGNDYLDARTFSEFGEGPSHLTGGAGTDQIFGSPSADTIRARDGEADQVACGEGEDVDVEFDDIDYIGGCEGVAVAITSGPSGLVNQRTAQLEFVVLVDPQDLPPGRYECSIDDPGNYTPCSSPVTLQSLGDGEHTFRVRYNADGKGPSGATARTWTVDATPPGVAITSAPSGENNPSGSSISFGSPASDLSGFVCKLDDQPEAACTSPHTVADLASGPHTFSVVAIDLAGNRSVATSAAWTVGTSSAPPEPPPAPVQAVACAAPAVARAAFGALVAVARSTAACFVHDGVNGELASAGEVAINGMVLRPDAGTRIRLEPRAGGGTLRVQGPSTLVLGRAELPLGSFVYDGLAAAGTGLANKTLAIAAGLMKLGGSPFVGNLAFELSGSDGGTSKVTASIELPKVLKVIPGTASGQGLTLGAVMTASNSRAATWAVSGRVSELYLGGVWLKDLALGYDDGTNVFNGSVAFELAGSGITGGGDGKLTAGIEIGPDGVLRGEDATVGIRKLSLVASGINKPVGPLVYLQKVGVHLGATTAAATFTGSAGASFGPSVDLGPLFEGAAASVDGSFTLTIPIRETTPKYSMELSGTGNILETPVANLGLSYSYPTRFAVTGSVDFTIAGYGLSGELRDVFFDTNSNAFSAGASGRANLPGAIDVFTGIDSAEGLWSEKGFVICFGAAGARFGVGKRVGGSLEPFGSSCDLGPFRSAAAASQYGLPRTVRIARGDRPAAIAALGAGGAPKVVVTGPKGERIETPAGPGPVARNGLIVVQDAPRSTTFILLSRPTVGRWTVTPSGGSQFTGVRVAEGLPRVTVSARVSGSGARRVLTWRARGLSGGQRLRLVERGADGSQVLATTPRQSGRVRFEPYAGRARARRIEAIVLLGGLPRSSQRVARFSARPATALRAVRGIRRTRAAISWRPLAGARLYVVGMRLADGTTLSRRQRAARIAIPRSARSQRLQVQVVALDAFESPGKPVRRSLAPPRRRAR